MQVSTFRCKNLNAFLTYDLPFFEDVSFVHGINGSGKTSILRAIVALLTPDPLWLCTTLFDELVVEFEHGGDFYRVSATSYDRRTVSLIVSGPTIAEDLLDKAQVIAASKAADEDYFHTILRVGNAGSPTVNLATVKVLKEIPTPIFLGLDRTTLTPTNQRENRMIIQSLGNKSPQPYGRTQLDDAIKEAEQMLKDRLGSLSTERNYIFEALRNDLVLSLFHIPTDEELARDPTDVSEGSSLIDGILRMQPSIIAALQNIRVKPEQIDKTVLPFFQSASKIAKSADAAQAKYERSKSKSLDIMRTYLTEIAPYQALLPYIAVIEGTLSHISEANKMEEAVSRPLKAYLTNINSFFSDSRKELIFQDNEVRVRLPSGIMSDLKSLSSGERQIFVLITHLVFNPAMRGENVLLIDEPELSLHLKWQRQFVAAIREASPTTQMILATHSPEIIFDMDDRLVPLEM